MVIFGSFIDGLLFLFAILALPFRGKSGSIKGQNAPIVVGVVVFCIAALVLVAPGRRFLLDFPAFSAVLAYGVCDCYRFLPKH